MGRGAGRGPGRGKHGALARSHLATAAWFPRPGGPPRPDRLPKVAMMPG